METRKSISVKSLNNIIVQVSTFFLLGGFPLQVITGQKLHYYIFFFNSLLLLVINIRPILNIYKLIYFSIIAIPVFFFLISKSIDTAFVFSLIPYIIAPLVYWGKAFHDFSFKPVMHMFQAFTVLYFIGVILQMLGFESIFLNIDLTITDGVLHDRYGSFAGGTLALGLTASFSLMYCLYEFVYSNNKSIKNIFLIIASLLTIVFAQSRRYYLFVFIIGFLIYWFNPNREIKNKKQKFKIILISTFITVLLVVFLYIFRDTNYYLVRIFSVFDFSGDESNVLRVVKWIEAIQYFLNNFWTGMGFGATGTIGKNFDPTVTSLDEIIVAESYYLKILVECGIIFGLTYFALQIFFLKKAFNQLKNYEVAFAAYSMIFFFIESFTSTALESAISSMLFWISASIILKAT